MLHIVLVFLLLNLIKHILIGKYISYFLSVCLERLVETNISNQITYSYSWPFQKSLVKILERLQENWFIL